MSDDAPPMAIQFSLLPESAITADGVRIWPLFWAGSVSASVTELPGGKLCFVVVGFPERRSAVLLCDPVMLQPLPSGDLGVMVDLAWTESHVKIALNGNHVCEELLITQ